MVEALAAGLVEACDDESLIRVDLWPVQRRLLANVETHRLNTWNLGRRSGKTRAAAIVLVWDATLRQLGGERRFSVGVATNLRQARLLLHEAREIVTRSPMLRRLLAEETDDELRFSTGATIIALPATARGVRGIGASVVVFDELAWMLDGDGNQAAEPMWAALVPATATFGETSRIIASSTPNGDSGLFADLYKRAEAGEIEDAVAHHATSAEANPTLSAAFLRSELERDPETFASEYEARFLTSGGAFLDAGRIAAAVTLPGELEPSHADGWVAGLDPAFSSDPFGLAIVGSVRPRCDEPERLVVGLVRSWQPVKAESFEEQRAVQDSVLAEVAETCLRYNVQQVCTDQYAAPAICDYLERRGLRVSKVPMTAASKTAVYSELRARLNMRMLDLPPHGQLLAELRRLRTRYAAGSASVVNPRVGGSHGDLAQALAVAVHEARHFGAPAEAPAIGWVEEGDVAAEFNPFRSAVRLAPLGQTFRF
ncbi:MAG: terminase large subunit domain-containing protein [Gaiellaceae bacterium]